MNVRRRLTGWGVALVCGVAPACASGAEFARVWEAPRWIRYASFSAYEAARLPEDTADVLSPEPMAWAGPDSPDIDFELFRLSAWAMEVGPPPPPPTTPEAPREITSSYDATELGMAVYAETGGLYPRQRRVGAAHDPSTWVRADERGGTADLHMARRMIAETRKSNKSTHLRARPELSDRLASRAWDACAAAADETARAPMFSLRAGERLHFFIRQERVGRTKADYLLRFEPVLTFGPFVNVGGGDVPKGAATYVDFYVLPSR